MTYEKEHPVSDNEFVHSKKEGRTRRFGAILEKKAKRELSFPSAPALRRPRTPIVLRFKPAANKCGEARKKSAKKITSAEEKRPRPLPKTGKRKQPGKRGASAARGATSGFPWN